VAEGVDDGQLPVVRELFMCQCGFQRGVGVGPASQRVEYAWAQSRIRDVLRCDHSDGCPGVCAARRYRGARRTDHDAECACGWVPCYEGERHWSMSSDSLITAVASISTSHSGR